MQSIDLSTFSFAQARVAIVDLALVVVVVVKSTFLG